MYKGLGHIVVRGDVSVAWQHARDLGAIDVERQDMTAGCPSKKTQNKKSLSGPMVLWSFGLLVLCSSGPPHILVSAPWFSGPLVLSLQMRCE